MPTIPCGILLGAMALQEPSHPTINSLVDQTSVHVRHPDRD